MAAASPAVAAQPPAAAGAPSTSSAAGGSVPLTPVIELRTGMKNLHVQFIVVVKEPPTKTKDGYLHQFLVGDPTGTVRLTMWDNTGESVEAADILRMSGAWTSLHRGTLTVYVGKMCTIKRIGRFTMAVNERINLSSMPWAQLDPDGSNRLLGLDQRGVHVPPPAPDQPAALGRPGPPVQLPVPPPLMPAAAAGGGFRNVRAPNRAANPNPSNSP